MPTLGRRKKLIQIVINYLVLPMVGRWKYIWYQTHSSGIQHYLIERLWAKESFNPMTRTRDSAPEITQLSNSMTPPRLRDACD